MMVHFNQFNKPLDAHAGYQNWARHNNDWSTRPFAADQYLKPGHKFGFEDRLILAKDLPTPRLELRWYGCQIGSKDYGCHYNLIIPLNENDGRAVDKNLNRVRDSLEVRISTTVEEVMTHNLGFENEDVLMLDNITNKYYLRAPLKEGIHASWDSWSLKLPAYVVFKDHAMFIEKRSIGQDPTGNSSYKAPRTVVMNNQDDVILFQKELLEIGIDGKLIDLATSTIVNAAMNYTTAQDELTLALTQLSIYFKNVMNHYFIERLFDICEDFHAEVVDILSATGIYLPDTGKAPYRYGGIHQQCVVLNFDDSN